MLIWSEVRRLDGMNMCNTGSEWQIKMDLPEYYFSKPDGLRESKLGYVCALDVYFCVPVFRHVTVLSKFRWGSKQVWASFHAAFSLSNIHQSLQSAIRTLVPNRFSHHILLLILYFSPRVCHLTLCFNAAKQDRHQLFASLYNFHLLATPSKILHTCHNWSQMIRISLYKS